MELAIVFLIIISLLMFIVLTRKSVDNTPHVKSPVIDDSSHLIKDLENARTELSQAYKEYGTLNSQFSIINAENERLREKVETLTESFEKLQHQKKSSEVRTGATIEVVSPLMENFPVPSNTMRFLGSPIDFVSFDLDNDQIVFLEVKSGDSQLSEKQRKIRRLIDENKVKFKEIRVNGSGFKIK